MLLSVLKEQAKVIMLGVDMFMRFCLFGWEYKDKFLTELWSSSSSSNSGFQIEHKPKSLFSTEYHTSFSLFLSLL